MFLVQVPMAMEPENYFLFFSFSHFHNFFLTFSWNYTGLPLLLSTLNLQLPGECGRQISAEKAWWSTLCILKRGLVVNKKVME